MNCTDDRGGVDTKPALKNGCVELAEVDRRLQVATASGLGIAQVEQRRIFAVSASFHIVPDHERNAPRSVVCAERAIHVRPPAEFGIDHDIHATTVRRREQREELIQRVVDVHPQTGMPFDAGVVGFALILVGVETTGVRMNHACSKVCADEVGGHGELSLESGESRDNARIGSVHHRCEIKRRPAELRPIVAERTEQCLLGHRSNGDSGALIATRG